MHSECKGVPSRRLLIPRELELLLLRVSKNRAASQVLDSSACVSVHCRELPTHTHRNINPAKTASTRCRWLGFLCIGRSLQAGAGEEHHRPRTPLLISPRQHQLLCRVRAQQPPSPIRRRHLLLLAVPLQSHHLFCLSFISLLAASTASAASRVLRVW